MKIVFIIPYFGKLPDYFSEWAYTAGYLEKDGIDFVVITDDAVEYELPSNITIKSMSFDEFKGAIQNKFDFNIALSEPYKICDYRPAFGYIFDDLVKGYDFWGNCDLDQVWGNVKHYITEEILQENEKILYLGHFSLCRNTSKMNFMFKNKGGMASYKEVFSSNRFYAFDEFAGMIAKCKANGVKTFYKPVFADIAVMKERITLRRVSNYKYQLLYWDNGRIFRSFIDDNSVKTDEFIYAHFQKKHPHSINSLSEKPKAFYITKDGFIPFDVSKLDREYILSHSDFESDEKDELDESKYKKEKMQKFLNSSLGDKCIWIRRKLFAKSI